MASLLSRSRPVGAIEVTTIKDSMEAIGFGKPALGVLPPDLTQAYHHFAGWKLETHCGSECQKLLDLAAPLLEAADPAARPDLWRGIVSAMAIICVG
jgi:hypothetical protein